MRLQIISQALMEVAVIAAMTATSLYLLIWQRRSGATPNQSPEPGRVQDNVRGLAEDDGDQAASLVWFGQALAEVTFQRITIQRGHSGPTQITWD